MNNQMPTIASRAFLALAAVIGALGVISAAAASHGEDTRLLGSIAMICLAHGPVLVALALLGLDSRWTNISGWALAAGTLVFSGDLAARHFNGVSPLTVAAPIGGLLMIAGWLVLVIAAVRPWSTR